MAEEVWWWLSSKRMTVVVKCEGGYISETPPIVRKFVGQPLDNLVEWLSRQGGLKVRHFDEPQKVRSVRARNTNE